MKISTNYQKFVDTNTSVLKRNKQTNAKRVVFLDRDGVMIEDVEYIHKTEDVVICQGLNNLLSYLKDNGNTICVATNQSSVARKIINEQMYEKITEKMLSLISNLNYPEYILASFYHKEYSTSNRNANWRKPDTGMFEYIKGELEFEVTEAAMIGDKLSDLKAASNFGIKNLIHIKSLMHKSERDRIKEWEKETGALVHYVDELKEIKKYL